MSNRFDDIIRKLLEKQESAVSGELFDKIRNHPDVQEAMFDGAIRSKMLETESLIPENAFEEIETAADLSNLPFDSFIGQKLNALEGTVPADMWDRIRQKKDRRRPVIAWWMAAGLIGLLGLGGWLWMSQKGIGKREGLSSVNSKENITYNNRNNIPSTNRKEKSSSAFDDRFLDEGKLASTSNGINNTNMASGNQVEKSLEKNAARKNRFLSQKKKEVDNDVTGVAAEENRIFNSSFENQLGENNLDFANTLSLKHPFLPQQLVNKSTNKLGQLLYAKALRPITPCPSTGDEKRNDWYVDVYASALSLHKNISDNFGTKNAKSGFDSTLHQQVSFNAGVNLVKNIGDNFLLKTGIQYNRINEAFRLTRINERRLVTTISIRTVILSPGDTIYIRDSSTVEQIGTVKQTRQNTYTQLDIPVILGYEFGGKSMRLNINAGLIANISSSYKGLVLDTLQRSKDINDVNGKAVYRKNVGLSLYAGISLVKPISNTLNIFIEPHARIGLTNQANEQMWFRQKNTITGLSLGIRYKLNNGRQRIY